MRVLTQLLPGIFIAAVFATISVMFGIMGIGDLVGGTGIGLAQWMLALVEVSVLTGLGALAVLGYSIYRTVKPAPPQVYGWLDD